MTTASILGLSLASIVLVGLVAWWLMREGFRLGDQPGDATTTATVVAAREGPQVHVTIDNPRQAPLFASVDFFPFRHHYAIALAAGRSTTARLVDLTNAQLLAVGGHGLAEFEWPIDVTANRTSIVVDIYIWQDGRQPRRHRWILTAYRRLDTGVIVGHDSG